MITRTSLPLAISLTLLVIATPVKAIDWINPNGGTFIGNASNWSSTLPGATSTVDFAAQNEGDYNVTYTITLDSHYTFSDLHNRRGNHVTLDLNDYLLTLDTNKASYFYGGKTTFLNGGTDVGFNFIVGGDTAGEVVLKETNMTTRGVSVGVARNSGNASNSSLVIEENSSLFAGATVAIGSASGGEISNQSLLQVIGSGASFTIASSASTAPQLRIGATTGSNGNRFEVLDGAKATFGEWNSTTGTITSTASIQLGTYQEGTSNNRALFSGEGTEVIVYGGMNIGRNNAATNANNRLDTENGASLTVHSNLSIYGTSATKNNKMVVGNGGTVTLLGTNNRIYYGEVVVEGGTLDAANLQLYTEGRLLLQAGEARFTNLSINGPGTRFGFDLSAGLSDSPTVEVTGAFSLGTVANVAEIDLFGVGAIGTYTLFTFNSGTNILSNRLRLGLTPEGFVGDLLFNANSIQLQVTAIPVIPEPGTLATLFAGGMLLLLTHRRRLTI